MCNGSSEKGLCTPSGVASKVNKVILEYNGRLGVVVCDFPGEELIRHLIN